MMATEGKVLIEFIQAWGDPGSYQIFGPPRKVWVNPDTADALVAGGYAKLADDEPKKPAKPTMVRGRRPW